MKEKKSQKWTSTDKWNFLSTEWFSVESETLKGNSDERVILVAIAFPDTFIRQ